MQFAVKNDEQSNTVFLELKAIRDGIVELWGHGPTDTYLMGRFEDGMFKSYLHPPGHLIQSDYLVVKEEC